MHRIARSLPAVAAALLATGALVALAGPAAAQQPGQSRATDPGIYVRGSLGYSFSTEDEVDYSPLWGLGVGYRFTPNLRTDVTIDWRDRYIVEGGRGFILGGIPVDSKVDNRAYMFNVYYEFDGMGTQAGFPGLRPYVGGGLGLSQLRVDGARVPVDTDGDGVLDGIRDFLGADNDQFAWQLMAGVGYHFTDNAWLDLGYRYARLGDVELTSTAGTIGTDLNAHEVVVSIGYKF